MEAVDVLTGYLRDLQARIAGRTTESLEALLNDLVPNLFKALASEANRAGIDLRGQVYEGNLGRPDFSVKDNLLLIGHVETKAPGDGADTRRFPKGHNRDQWQRFKRLPNLVYTDGEQFALYRSGERVGPIVDLDFDPKNPKQEATPESAERLVALLRNFLSYKAVAPTTLTQLAERLAPLCAVLRDAVLEKLEDPQSEVAKAAKDARNALFPDRTDAEVADAIAQVCSYSMLLARANGATKLDAPSVEAALAAGHPVLGRVVTVLLDKATERELGWALDTVRSLIEAVDFGKLRKSPLPGMQHYQRTWLYFYEEFLAKYDPKLRDQYGVYYTPAAVIQAQVGLLNQVLSERLGQKEGFGSSGVTVIDPAVGTGSYALEIIERVANATEDSRGLGAVPGVLNNLARNLYAFEILVGPYAVAHLRVSEILQDFGADTPEDGPRVFLTDTLSNPYAEPLSLTRQLEPLVEEQKRATEVKGQQDILVCLGNPPYERLSAVDEEGVEKGGWVVHGEGGGAGAIFGHFSGPARKKTAVGHLRSLYNLYTFFWRWALWKVFESPNVDGTGTDQPGVVSFITASSFLTGPGFLGMREHMRRLCDEIWVIDLGGDNRGARKEPNIFATETPVAITMAVREGPTRADTPANVHYARIRGSRADKLSFLNSVDGLDDLHWEPASKEWEKPFTPASTADWEAHPALTALFPLQMPGPVIARTWPVTVTEQNAHDRWAALKRAAESEKALYFDDKRFGRNSKTRPSEDSFPPPADLKRISELRKGSANAAVERYAYRSFDRRWVVADSRVMRTPSQTLWAHHSDEQVYLVSMLTNVIGAGPAATVASRVPDYHYFAGRGGKDVIPLYRDRDLAPNLPKALLSELHPYLGQLGAEELFAYAVGLITHPAYTETFWEHLETPGPRVPITTDRELFDEVAAQGEEIIGLHTYGERGHRGQLAGSARVEASIGPSMPEDFDYDPDTETLRIGTGNVRPVSPSIWNFTASGLEVVRSWVRGRLRDPTGNAKSSKSPLDQLRPTQWTSEMDEELLDLLWTLEGVLKREVEQKALLEKVLAGPTVPASELTAPADEERQPAPIPGRQGPLFAAEGEGDLATAE
ncbi:MAG: type ISP restriction/modification enzyme [Actinomycetota bacterium]